MAEPGLHLESINPVAVLEQVAASIPADCRKNIIVVGSLAVGYQFFSNRKEMVVRTKDADCLLSPRVQAVEAGTAITERLMDENWKLKKDSRWGHAGNTATPDEELPAVRLNPPGTTQWFIELLTTRDPGKKKWIRLKTKYGHFGLRCFDFLSLANYKPHKTSSGIFVARPEMMALANLLEHQAIEEETMSHGFAGRMDIKRSNKDLGRVLAIARLSLGRNEDELLNWPELWKEALQDRFSKKWRELAGRTGDGIRLLLDNDPDLEQAYHTCVNGLLAGNPPTLEGLKIAGKRLLQDSIEPFEEFGR